MTMRPPKGFRPHMSMRVKIEAALIMLGLDPATVQWDHDPAIQLRIWDENAGDTIPPANDPRYITPMIKGDHKRKTNGTKATSYGSDKHAIAKVKRFDAARNGQTKPKRKIASRPFQNQQNNFNQRSK